MDRGARSPLDEPSTSQPRDCKMATEGPETGFGRTGAVDYGAAQTEQREVECSGYAASR